jgi:hypothetical protein
MPVNVELGQNLRKVRRLTAAPRWLYRSCALGPQGDIGFAQQSSDALSVKASELANADPRQQPMQPRQRFLAPRAGARERPRPLR